MGARLPAGAAGEVERYVAVRTERGPVAPAIGAVLGIRATGAVPAEAHPALHGGSHRLAETRTALVEELEWPDRELEAFSGSVSHDLRAPLQVISSVAEHMLDDEDDPAQRRGDPGWAGSRTPPGSTGPPPPGR